MGQDIKLPSTSEEWIDLFNRTSELLGYPDARDDFHGRNDLRYCLTACGALLETYDLVRWRRPSVKTTVRGAPVTLNVDVATVFDKEHLCDEQVDHVLTLVKTEMESVDILPAREVLSQRGLLKMALIKMAKSSMVTRHLHLVSLEETIEKHGPLPQDT